VGCNSSALHLAGLGLIHNSVFLSRMSWYIAC